MNVLSDDCLLRIFQKLPLHERANLRLASKRFRRLLDTIQIKKLVVYVRNEPVSGKLAFTNESYQLVDTAYVSGPQKFFASPIIRNQLNGVQTLVIYGYMNQFKIDLKFDNLKHLEMQKIFMENTKIFESPSIECLKIHDCFCITALDPFAPRESVAEGSFKAMGFGDLRSKSIKRLALHGLYESAFYIYLHQKQLCNSLQEINIIAMDFEALIYLAKHCKTLKVIEIVIPRMFEAERLPQVINKRKLQKIANGFRNGLCVYLYGVLWNKRNCRSVWWFLQTFVDTIYYHVPERKLEFCPFRKPTLDMLPVVSGNAPDLTRFRQLVNILDLTEGSENPLDFMSPFLHSTRKIDQEPYRCFINCEEIIFNPAANCGDFKKYLTIFPNLLKMTLVSKFNQSYGDEKLNLIGERCTRLEQLSIEHWARKRANFAFLAKLTRLTKLKLMLFCPIDQNELLAKLTKSRFIEQVDVYFAAPKNLNKGQLSDFKKRVNAMLSQKFPSKKLAFAIQLYTDKGRQFVRYALYSNKFGDEENSIDEEDRETMVQLIEYATRSAPTAGMASYAF